MLDVGGEGGKQWVEIAMCSWLLLFRPAECASGFQTLTKVLSVGDGAVYNCFASSLLQDVTREGGKHLLHTPFHLQRQPPLSILTLPALNKKGRKVMKKILLTKKYSVFRKCLHVMF
jgi:hypothetical protein